jgi:meiotically up-regulated gene 157 (Mug157) protein
MNRRSFLHSTLAFAAAPSLLAQAASAPPLSARPALADRRFSSPVIESTITSTQAHIADPTLALIFANCLPNTLDTTVFPSDPSAPPDTYVITGDIDAMWLRDSSAQLYPYCPFAAHDPALARLITGAIHRLTRNILLDPYANAFTRDTSSPALPWAIHDHTDMKPGVAERKWEIDSLCYPIRLAHHFWKSTGNTAPFDADWLLAARLILQTFRTQQRLSSPGPYSFQRSAFTPTDTVPLNGFGNPTRPTGLIHSIFRPSDDATIFPLFIPANLFAIATLHQIAEIASTVYNNPALAADCSSLATTVQSAVATHGIVQHPTFGRIYAYEVDGFGGVNLMDDANAPSLLSLAYLIPSLRSSPIYQASRRFALSPANPYFFRGTAAEGIGGPHIGLNYIWPMSILMRAFTSTSDPEILLCLRTLRDTTANTHFMHESFHKDNPSDYTRPWFAWANTLFGELILTLQSQRPHLLHTPL